MTTPDFKLPDDDWCHVLPRGEFTHHKDGLIQVIDDAAIASIVEQFESESQQPGFCGVLVDYDHFSTDLDKSSEAAGWITALEERSDGIWMQVRWTDKGEESLRNGRYRFTSAVFLGADMEDLGGERKRPLRLDSVGLTNSPGLPVKALTNRAPGSAAVLNSKIDSGADALKGFAEHLNDTKVRYGFGEDTASDWAAWLEPELAIQSGFITSATGTIATATAQELADRFYRLVLARQKYANFLSDFSGAWNSVRKLEPRLYAAMSEASPLRAQKKRQPDASEVEDQQRAGAEVQRLVNREKKAYGISFTDAWNRVRSREPKLFNRMAGQ